MAAQEREMRTRRAALSSREQVLVQRESQLERQIEAYSRQRASAIEQGRLIEEEIAGVQILADKGLSPLTRLRALQRQKSALEGQVGEYDALTARAEEQIGETTIQRTLLRQERSAEIAEELRVVEDRISELRPQYTELGAQMERLRIRAPASGVVVGLKVFTPGGVVPPGATVMEIVPQDRGLLIEAQIRPEDADDLTPNQRTEIKLLAFHQRELPILDGVVRQISADRFVDERTGASFFKAELEVSAEALALVEEARGRQVELRPGMPVEVVIPLRARTALEYAFEPLTQSMWRSFREQ
jgi:HlyD family secretion protein